MTALYLIAQEYRSAAAQLADLDLPPEVIEDTLESLSGDLEVKSQNVGHMVRAMEADAAAMKTWASEATARAKAMEARAERLREYLAGNLIACGILKVSGPGIEIGFRKSSAVVVNEPGLIPAEFMRQRPPPPAEPDKTAIAAALKAGKEVPGAHLETRQNLQIK